MNVFILNTGRCGSTTFAEACRHITNYTCGHETRWGKLGADHFAYPENHIEADNRLSWFLGRLEQTYGDSAFYVHLRRNREAVAKSFLNRYGRGIISAYERELLTLRESTTNPLEICQDYYDTVNANIEFFLDKKSRKITIDLEQVKAVFPQFWEQIGAEGDLQAALKEWDIPHNATDRSPSAGVRIRRFWGKVSRTVTSFPTFLKNA